MKAVEIPECTKVYWPTYFTMPGTLIRKQCMELQAVHTHKSLLHLVDQIEAALVIVSRKTTRNRHVLTDAFYIEDR